MSYPIMAAIDADVTAVTSASALAEEALALHCAALSVLSEGWRSESGCAATDLIRRQCEDAAELVAALQGAAADFRALRDVVEGDPAAGDPMAGAAADGTGPTPDTAAGNRLAQASARLADRPQPSFGGPAPLPAYGTPAAAAPSTMTWPSIGLPDIGGALVGLVAQIADAVIPQAADTSSPVELTDEVSAQSDPAAVPPETGTPEPAALPAPVSQPLPAPELSVPVNEPVPQPEPPEPAPETPLLAAERPPEREPPAPAAAEPPAGPQTPCEIAADELPQVGE